MKSSNFHPKWGRLYLTLPLLVGLFVLDHQLKISTGGHEAIQIGILVTIYGLVYWWLKSNSMALSSLDRQKYHSRRTTIVEISVPQLPEANPKNRPSLGAGASQGSRVVETYQNDAVGLLSVHRVQGTQPKE